MPRSAEGSPSPLGLVTRRSGHVDGRLYARPVTRRRVPFVLQALALQLGVITLVVAAGLLLVGVLLDRESTAQYLDQALAVARSFAADPEIGDAVAHDDPHHLIPGRAAHLSDVTGALFVVVTDDRGIRLAHPNPALIGQLVSTSPSRALSGEEVVAVERGTLGVSARAKVPLRDRTGRIVGEISVGFALEDVRSHLLKVLGTATMFAAGALLLGFAGSALLTWRLKRLTLSLEPSALAELMLEHEAVLHGIGEGVLAVDGEGRISVCNEEAAILLGLTGFDSCSDRPASCAAKTALECGRAVRGVLLDDLDLPPGLRTVLDRRAPVHGTVVLAGERVLLVSVRDVHHDGQDLGRILTVRDRTDVENLVRELDAVRSLTDGLRAQRHEFANRLHTLSGLLQTGHQAKAVDYLQALAAPQVADLGDAADAVQDPYLQAFLAAKTSIAAEQGLQLRLADECAVFRHVTAPVEVTTVLGNLVDNALEAARLGRAQPGWVEVALVAEGRTLHIAVLDSGDGVPPEIGESIFKDGVSTRAGDNRGLGLALAGQAARSLGGSLTLADPGGTDGGAVIVAALPGALAESPVDGVTYER